MGISLCGRAPSGENERRLKERPTTICSSSGYTMRRALSRPAFFCMQIPWSSPLYPAAILACRGTDRVPAVSSTGIDRCRIVLNYNGEKAKLVRDRYPAGAILASAGNFDANSSALRPAFSPIARRNASRSISSSPFCPRRFSGSRLARDQGPPLRRFN